MEQPLTLSIAEAAVALGISTQSAYSAARRGEIPSVRIGNRLVVPRAQLARLLGDPSIAPYVAPEPEAPPPRRPDPPVSRERAPRIRSLDILVEPFIALMDDRSAEVVRRYYGIGGKQQTMDEIGDAMGISGARVSQLHRRGIAKAHAALQRGLAAVHMQEAVKDAREEVEAARIEARRARDREQKEAERVQAERVQRDEDKLRAVREMEERIIERRLREPKVPRGFDSMAAHEAITAKYAAQAARVARWRWAFGEPPVPFKAPGGLIHQPTHREMGVDAPDFGPTFGG